MKRSFRACWYDLIATVKPPGEDRMAIVRYNGFPWYQLMREEDALEVLSSKNEKELRIVVCVDGAEMKRMIEHRQTEMFGGD